MNRYRFLRAVLFLLMLLISVVAFASESEVLVKGRVLDELSGDSLLISFEFRAPDGTKKLVKPDSLTGIWEVKLNWNEEYRIIFDNPAVMNEEKIFMAPKTDSNTAITLDFTVKRFQSGLELFKYDFFPANSSALSARAKDDIFGIGEFMRVNKFVDLEILVSANDSYSLPPAPPETPKKKNPGKKNKREIIADAPGYDTLAVQALVELRVIALRNYIESEIAFRDRIAVIADFGLKEENIVAMPAESRLRVK